MNQPSYNSNNASTADRVIAMIATLVIAVLAVLTFLCVYISAPVLDVSLPEKNDTDSLFVLEANEYTVPVPVEPVRQTGGKELKKGDDASATGDKESQPALDDRAPSSKEEVRTEPREEPSKGNVPTKTTAKSAPDATADQAKVKADREAKEKAERDAQAAEIRNSMKFNGGGEGTGKEGVKNGNSDKGEVSAAAPGHDLAGRTAESWGKPRSTKIGTVRVRVTVNAQGKVVSAKAVSGSGLAWTDAATKRSCESAALQSRFSVRTDNQTEQTGTITFNFK